MNGLGEHGARIEDDKLDKLEIVSPEKLLFSSGILGYPGSFVRRCLTTAHLTVVKTLSDADASPICTEGLLPFIAYLYCD
jgi:hypothetical protein